MFARAFVLKYLSPNDYVLHDKKNLISLVWMFIRRWSDFLCFLSGCTVVQKFWEMMLL